MEALLNRLQSRSKILIFALNIIFFTISLALCLYLHSPGPSVVISAFLFVLCQSILLWIIFREAPSLKLLRENWPVFLTCMSALAYLLMIIIRCQNAMETGGTYSMLGIMLCIFMIYMTALISELIVSGKWNFENLFATQAILFGIVLGMVFPLNTIADEPQHMRTAYNLSNIMMGIQSPEKTVMMRQDDADYDFGYTVYDINDINRYLFQLTAPLKDGTLVPVSQEEATPHTLDYSRIPKVFKTEWYQYVPSAAGITLGRLLKLNTIATYLLGRLFNLLFYTGIIFLCLKVLPVGKSILYTIALFPISLQIASSMSRDAFRISAAVLVVALTLYLFYTDQTKIRFRKTLTGLLIVSGLLLFPLRSFIYSLTAILPLMIFAYRKKWITDRMVRNTAITCAGLSVVLILLKYLVFPGDIVEEPKILLSWTNEYRYTKEVFINHPLFTFTYLKNTLFHRGDYYLKTMIGYQLGWLDLNIPDHLVSALLILLAISAIRRDYEPLRLSNRMRFTLFVTSAVSIVLIIMGITLQWTPVTSSVAEGVQGRYFLPIALPMLLAFRGKSISANEKCDVLCICIQFIALIMTTAYLIMRLL